MTIDELQLSLERKRAALGIKPRQSFNAVLGGAIEAAQAQRQEPAPPPSPGLPTAGECACEGLGWIVVPDGGAGRARRCSCRAPAPELLLREAGLPEEFNPPLDTWVGPQADLKNFPATAHCLTVWGNTGRGKSRVAADFVAGWVRGCRRARWWKVADLLASIKDSWDIDDGARAWRITGELAAVDLLVLDDIFAEQDTPWSGSEVSRFVTRRISDRRPTIFTTNLPPEKIAQIEPRLYSRLWDTDAAQTEMGGPDWRLL